jgi:glycosyltransferase involved in cell wall biosynthesis
MGRTLRIAVVSPFLDKRHGTERCVAEQVEKLAFDHDCEIVLYSQKVTDLSLSADGNDSSNGRITWRKVPNFPGPQLVRFIWWFFANHAVRYVDRRMGRFKPDLVYSPGPNCLDANVIGVHIVFAEFYVQLEKQLGLLGHPLRSWPRLLHRIAYYRLAIALERHVYRNEQIVLAGVAKKVAKDLMHTFGRAKNVCVIYHGVKRETFNPEVRAELRAAARESLGLADFARVLLLVGNDFKKKGLLALLEAMAHRQNPSLYLLVVGHDDPTPFRMTLRRHNLVDHVIFLPERPDIEWYYAAADAYVGPSLEDSFALPPLEAMACGLPVIVSKQAGVSEILTHGSDALILENPTDVDQLACFIGILFSEPELSKNLGDNAAKTARKYTWEANAELLFQVFRRVHAERDGP